MIMDACAKAVGAETGSLALYDEQQQALSVSATFGYSAALVRYLRVRAGEGIIGSVYRSGRTMLIEDVRQIKGGRSPRLRYRTSSFMCVPLLGANRVLGVISVADRRDRQPFDRIDLRNLRMIAGVASLVLERASALQAAKIKEGEAAVDPLTGLFNRRSFRKRLNEEIERAGRQGSPLSLTIVDVDNFKRLNDQLGHRVGDSALQLVANVLQRSIRLFDTSARLGGDEFAILMPGSGLDSSRHIAQRIRESIEEARPSGQQWSEDANVTVSMGIATLTDTSADEFVDRADRALYMAKRDGKNCVRWWEEPSAPSQGALPTEAERSSR
jgi:diguanylate cyclase (GGDEF)-like protein